MARCRLQRRALPRTRFRSHRVAIDDAGASEALAPERHRAVREVDPGGRGPRAGRTESRRAAPRRTRGIATTAATTARSALPAQVRGSRRREEESAGRRMPDSSSITLYSSSGRSGSDPRPPCRPDLERRSASRLNVERVEVEARHRRRSPPAQRGSASASGRANVTGSSSVGSMDLPVPALGPVAAGISFPMITFSFRPSRWSTLPLDRGVGQHLRSSPGRTRPRGSDSVASDAFVIPRISGSKVACSLLLLLDPRVLACSRTILSTSWPGRSSVSPRVLDADLLQHLPDDQLDVLVVDLDALRLVDAAAPRRRGTARSASSPCRPSRAARAARPGRSSPRWSGSPGSTCSPFVTSRRVRRGQRVADLGRRSPSRPARRGRP